MDLIVDFLLAKVKKRFGVDLSTNQIVRLRLREAAEKAKKKLSSALFAPISVKYLEMGEDGPIHLDTMLTRAQFREIIGDDGVEDDVPSPEGNGAEVRTAVTVGPSPEATPASDVSSSQPTSPWSDMVSVIIGGLLIVGLVAVLGLWGTH